MNQATLLSAKAERSLLLTLAAIQFTHILDFMIMMPLGPHLTRSFNLSVSQFGLLVSAYTLAAGASGLLAALFIDRFERKSLFLVLYGLFGLSTLACGLAQSYEALLVARTLAGIFGGIQSGLVHTMVADLVPFERRGKAMGILMTAFSASTVMGVPLGLLIADQWNWHVPFVVIAGASAVLVVLGQRLLPVMNTHLKQAGERPSVWAGLMQVVKVRNHLTAYSMTFCLLFAGFSVIPYITLYMTNNAGMTTQQVPLMYLLGGLATLVSAPWIGRMADQAGKLVTLRRITLLSVLPLMGITVSAGLPVWALMVICTAFFVLVSGRMIPGMALASSAANPAVRGAYMTLNSAVQSSAMALASLLGGHVVVSQADGTLGNYWVCAFIALGMNALALLAARRVKVQA